MKLNKIKSIHVFALIIAVIHFVSTFFTEKLFFNEMTIDSEHIVSFILCKILLVIILVAFWQFVFRALFGKSNDLRSIFKYSVIYFIPMMFVLLTIWPGLLGDGDFSYFLRLELDYDYNYYLHYFTSLVHIIGMMIFPFITGVFIFQSICYSVIVGYLIHRTRVYFDSKFAYLLYFIFALPSIVHFSLYMNRTPLFSYIYILVIGILIFDYLEKKILTVPKLIILIVSAALLSKLRYEGVYLLLTMPILITIAYRLKNKFKKTVLLIVAIFIAMQIINIPQKQWEDKYDGNFFAKRMIPAITHTISNMLKDDIVGDLDIIDKVVSVDIMRETADIQNVKPLAEGAERKNFSETEAAEFVKEYINIVFKNIPAFLDVRLETLHKTALHDYVCSHDISQIKIHYLEGKSILINEFMPNRREQVLVVLENHDLEIGDYGIHSKYLIVLNRIKNFVAYNLYIPFAILMFILILSIYKKNYLWLFMTLGAVAHTGLIFGLAPAAFFMYYLPVHMLGWFLGSLMVINTLVNRVSRKDRNLFEK